MSVSLSGKCPPPPSRTEANAGHRGAGRVACARRMLQQPRAPGAPSKGGGGSVPTRCLGRMGLRTSCRAALHTARSGLLQQSLPEPAPPGRALPLHKRPRRRRTPTHGNLQQEEEGAERRGHSPPPRCRKPWPPPLTASASTDREQLRSPRNRTCCSAGHAPQTSYWLRQPNPS